ncbi:MAG: hypothetical protein LBD43_02775 [Holosporales bacterium]|jgi:hypothetical protein|nr:hypothetical protein [Holosporales bacterium]
MKYVAAGVCIVVACLSALGAQNQNRHIWINPEFQENRYTWTNPKFQKPQEKELQNGLPSVLGDLRRDAPPKPPLWINPEFQKPQETELQNGQFPSVLGDLRRDAPPKPPLLIPRFISWEEYEREGEEHNRKMEDKRLRALRRKTRPINLPKNLIQLYNEMFNEEYNCDLSDSY